MRCLMLIAVVFGTLAAAVAQQPVEKKELSAATATARFRRTDCSCEKKEPPKLVKPDDPANDAGRIRWQYLVERIDRLEKESADLKKRLVRLEAAEAI